MVEHLGYKSIGIQWQVEIGLSREILTDEVLVRASQERLSQVEIIPDKKLTRRKLAHLNLARSIADLTFSHNRVAGIYAAIIPAASDRVRTAGMYSRETRAIYISADQLQSGQDTVDTVIHELAHHLSQAEDGDEAHNAAMTKVAAMVVRKASEGYFDNLVREVVWHGGR